MTATVREVARRAGVSPMTVSRVVNGEPGVSPALEAKVRRAIEQLNYRRDANASMLRRLGGKTQTIGLVLEDVANPFSSALHRAIEDSARLGKRRRLERLNRRQVARKVVDDADGATGAEQAKG